MLFRVFDPPALARILPLGAGAHAATRSVTRAPTLRDCCERGSGQNNDSESDSWYATHLNLLRFVGTLKSDAECAPERMMAA